MNIRHDLVEATAPHYEYSYVGAIAIHQELSARGIKAPPTPSTINRILKNHGLVIPRRKKKGTKSGIYYPELVACHPGHRHEVDLVTPRYISGYGKVIAVNRIDVFTSQANLQVFQSKGADSVIEFLVEDWKEFGIPRYLQLDNEASFRGGLRHPRSIGKLIRFCLNFGVQLIFIPWKEPWRNPYIENFNGNFNRLLWMKKRFTDLAHLQREARRFLDKHNTYQTYKKDRFSHARADSHTTTYLPSQFHFDPACSLPITKGKIHFVRLVETGGIVNVLNERFETHPTLSADYVWITIDTAKELMSIYYQPVKEHKRQLVKEQEYKLREPVTHRIPVTHFKKCQRCLET